MIFSSPTEYAIRGLSEMAIRENGNRISSRGGLSLLPVCVQETSPT